jgi:hypothetical protein
MQVSVDVEDDHQSVQLRATSSAISFPGFLAVYKVRSSWASSFIMSNPSAESELINYKVSGIKVLNS